VKKNKISSTYRLQERTREQIKFLAERYEISEADVVEIAVDYICDNHRKVRKEAVPNKSGSHPATMSDILPKISL
jgi:hypothetical protein